MVGEGGETDKDRLGGGCKTDRGYGEPRSSVGSGRCLEVGTSFLPRANAVQAVMAMARSRAADLHRSQAIQPRRRTYRRAPDQCSEDRRPARTSRRLAALAFSGVLVAPVRLTPGQWVGGLLLAIGMVLVVVTADGKPAAGKPAPEAGTYP